MDTYTCTVLIFVTYFPQEPNNHFWNKLQLIYKATKANLVKKLFQTKLFFSPTESLVRIYRTVTSKCSIPAFLSNLICCIYCLQADIRSREYLRQHYTEELKNCSCRIQNNDDNTSTAEKDDEKNKENVVDDTCQTFSDLKLN